MKKLNLFLLTSLCLVLNNVSANEASTYCTDYKADTKKGDQAYQAKDYPMAINAYRDAVYNIELCMFNSDEKNKQQPLWKGEANTIYNSIALAYLKNSEPMKAAQYLSIADEKDKKTVFNRSLVQKVLSKVGKERSIAGNYWQYSGIGIWNRITVTPSGDLWAIDMHGTYPGYNWGGVNLGNLQTLLPLVDNKIRYEVKDKYLECDITLTFSENGLHAETGNNECGFGHNVSINGDFSRVEFDGFTDVIDSTKLEDFIPQGWREIAKAEGDLNKDGKPDAALIIEATDQSRMINNDALGAPILNVNPRHLLVLVKQDSGAYLLVKENTNFIPRENDAESGCLEDPLMTTDFKIHNGNLEITLHYWLSCGSYSVSNDKYTFRLDKKDLRLIGLDNREMTRISPNDSTSISINLLTNKRKSTVSTYDEDKDSTSDVVKWTKIQLNKPIFIDDIKTMDQNFYDLFYKDAY